ncbi:MAG: VCBS repeat-containing protein [Bacteroidia bacterium]|nr:VCBS repeat-containing protein [Bacteroidia bacterium]
MNQTNWIPAFLISLVFLSCGKNQENLPGKTPETEKITPVFSLLDPTSSGFNYQNNVVENEDMNVMAYEYYYNGSGVAIGDLNNDGLPEIVMGGNLYGARVFLNEGNLKFRDITESARVLTNAFQTGITLADVNADGFLDIYLCKSFYADPQQRRNLLFINNQDLTFTEKGKDFGLDDPGFSNHASFFDYDGDGDLDMFLINHRADFQNVLYIIPEREWKGELARMRQEKGLQYTYFSNKLYRNEGNNTFTDVTIPAGLMTYDYTLSATIGDINQDNRPDIYVTSDYATKDHLYINQGDGTFADQIESMMMHISKNSMGSDIADYNNDGLPDIVTTDMVSEENYRQKQLRGFAPYDIFQSIAEYKLHYQVEGNCLQINNGQGAFSEVAKFAGVAYTDWSWAPLLADFDNDGRKDLFVTNGYARDVTDMDYIKYTSPDIIRKSGGPQFVRKMELLSSVPSTPLTNYMYHNEDGLQFKNVSTAWGLGQNSFSNGAAYGDLDQDGDLDLVVNNFNQASFLYKNQSRETQPDKHYLALELKGPKENPFAEGAKIWVVGGGETQYQELYPCRGFLSCVDHGFNFGLGENKAPLKVVVQWPNGKTKVLDQVSPDQKLVVTPENGRDTVLVGKALASALLTQKVGLDNPPVLHQESAFVDFKSDGLLENAISQMGPWLARADVNGDGLDDFYFGGGSGTPGKLYLQGKNGKFQLSAQPEFNQHQNKKDGKSIFLDTDGDGDLDLFVTSGFHETDKPENYGLRLYLNDGRGNFTFASEALPAWTSPAESAVSADFDGDGDPDIFVGGAALMGQYPRGGRSCMLINNQGKFTLSSSLPNEGDLGLVHDVLASDLNQDGKPELVLARAWQPIGVLGQVGGKWVDETEKWGLAQSDGLWYSLEQVDIDQDGDLDIIAGNRGTNSPYRVSAGSPGVLSQSDLDGNGAVESMISYYFPDGKLYPKYSLDQITTQAPGLRGRFNTYKSYSYATSEEVVGPEKWSSAPKWYLKQVQSLVLLNDGKGKFTQIPLNPEAQMFPLKDLLVRDLNADGKPDLVLVGNHFDTSPDLGREDAGRGLILLGEGEGKFRALSASQSGFYLNSDSRQILALKSGNGKTIFLVGNNQGPLEFFE